MSRRYKIVFYLKTIEIYHSQRNTIGRVGNDDRYFFNLSWVDQIFSNTSDLENEAYRITLAPNPADDILTISIEKPKHEKYNLEVFNNLGQLQLHTTMTSQLELNTGTWQDGIYHYRISNKEGFNSAGLWSIQHK